MVRCENLRNIWFGSYLLRESTFKRRNSEKNLITSIKWGVIETTFERIRVGRKVCERANILVVNAWTEQQVITVAHVPS